MDISLSITKQWEKHTLTFIYLIMYFVSHLMHVFYYLIIEVRVCKYLTMTMNSIKHNGSWLNGCVQSLPFSSSSSPHKARCHQPCSWRPIVLQSLFPTCFRTPACIFKQTLRACFAGSGVTD